MNSSYWPRCSQIFSLFHDDLISSIRTRSRLPSERISSYALIITFICSTVISSGDPPPFKICGHVYMQPSLSTYLIAFWGVIFAFALEVYSIIFRLNSLSKTTATPTAYLTPTLYFLFGPTHYDLQGNQKKFSKFLMQVITSCFLVVLILDLVIFLCVVISVMDATEIFLFLVAFMCSLRQCSPCLRFSFPSG